MSVRTMALQEAAQEFADRLNTLVDATIRTDRRLGVNTAENADHAVVRTISDPGIRFDGFPLVRDDDKPGASALLLVVRFVVKMGDDGRRLRVERSLTSLWVDVTGGRKTPRPLVRVEYDRRRQSVSAAAAHVHLHANSPEIAWIYGSSGQSAPDLHSLHFPVGGQLFRPTLEDFLLFLEREKLYTNFKTGWKAAVQDSLKEWERSQAASTVRRYHDTAVSTLTELGYTITAPPAP